MSHLFDSYQLIGQVQNRWVIAEAYPGNVTCLMFFKYNLKGEDNWS